MLPPGSTCDFEVDATEAMGRIQFNRTSELGVLINGYTNGMPITVPKGRTQTVTVYNGRKSGQVFFDLVVSGASMALASATGATALALEYLY